MHAFVLIVSLCTETPDSSDSGLGAQGNGLKDSSSLIAVTNPSLSANDDSKSHELSNLRLENQLLRNEVQSLNQEVASLIQRSKETQEGTSAITLVKC